VINIVTKDEDEFEKLMRTKKFDVEHALGMYALSFYSLPAEAIYEVNLDKKLGDGITKCHIYLIGKVPKIDLRGARQEDKNLVVEFEVLGNLKTIFIGPMPAGVTVQHEGDLWHLKDQTGKRHVPQDEYLYQAFQERHGPLEFEVLYVGQAYGKDGSRHALDRLKNHQTLQKIALKETQQSYRLQVLLVEIHPATRMFTFFNPFAADKSRGEERIRRGLDKLFGTNEHERITLYEASLITYFQPKYNKEFKNSFPSTSLKTLADCYDKDFSSVVSEICFEPPPFLLHSDCVSADPEHIVTIDLHSEAERKVFFAVE